MSQSPESAICKSQVESCSTLGDVEYEGVLRVGGDKIIVPCAIVHESALG